MFGLASRSLCHETIFPSMGLGQGWDLDWGLGFVSRGGPRSGGIWRGFLSTATTPSPATSLHFPGTPSKHIKPLLRLQGGACIFGFQSVKANAFGHVVRHNFQDLYLASFFQVGWLQLALVPILGIPGGSPASLLRPAFLAA